jgi:hypothetical protein
VSFSIGKSFHREESNAALRKRAGGSFLAVTEDFCKAPGMKSAQIALQKSRTIPLFSLQPTLLESNAALRKRAGGSFLAVTEVDELRASGGGKSEARKAQRSKEIKHSRGSDAISSSAHPQIYDLTGGGRRGLGRSRGGRFPKRFVASATLFYYSAPVFFSSSYSLFAIRINPISFG